MATGEENAGLPVQIIVKKTPGVSPLKWGRFKEGETESVQSRIPVLKSEPLVVENTTFG